MASVSPGFVSRLHPSLLISSYNGRLVTGLPPNIAAYIFVFRLVLFCKHLQFHDFVRFLLTACIILLYNHKHPVLWRPLAVSWPGDSVLVQLAAGARSRRASNKTCIPNLLPTNRRQWLCNHCWPMGVFDVALRGGGSDHGYVKESKLFFKSGLYNWR
jgi:hypothetical protein